MPSIETGTITNTLRLIMLLLLLLLVSLATAGEVLSMKRGAKYAIGFGSNHPERIPTLQVYISTLEPFPVLFEITTLLGFRYHGRVTPNSAVNVTIPVSYKLTSFSDGRKGIFITTNNGTIMVHGLNYDKATTDGFLALPCTSLNLDNYEYYALTYPDNYDEMSPGFLVIVACEDATVVNHGSSTTTINRMETLYLQEVVDYSGARVQTSKPVSFFAGQECPYVPSDVTACDHLVEQIPPTAVWGTQFLSASYFSRSSGELYRILTASSSTIVTVNCNTFSQPQTFNLISAGSWTEFRTDDSSFCSIKSNNPLLVMEFSLGGSIDGVGDPFMMMIPSLDQYTNDYLFHSPITFLNYITILVTPQYYQPHQILVDGVSQENANWAPVHCANGSVCGYCAYVTLEPGDHHVWHSDFCAEVSVLMYGFNNSVSYGQPAGIFYAYYRVPSNFSHTVVEGDPHSVRFTWSPPPEQGQRGEITHYTINCTSECGGNKIIVSQTGLKTVISSFTPGTHYWCSISASTTCHGEDPYSDAIQLLTVPDVVKNLTVRLTGDDLLLHWNVLDGIVSHYIVTVYQEGDVLKRYNVSQQFLIISLERYEMLQISVSAANSAGVGQPAVTFFEQSNQSDKEKGDSGESLAVIGGAVAAATGLIIIAVVVTIIVVAKIKRKNCCHLLTLPTNGNTAHVPNRAVTGTPTTIGNVAYAHKNVVHATNQQWLNFSPLYAMPNEPPPLPPRNDLVPATDISENNTDGEFSDVDLDYLDTTL